MFKKVMSIFLCFALLTLAGCSLTKKVSDNNSSSSAANSDNGVSKDEKKEDMAINPLTGLPLSKDKINARPIAVMINNMSTAQSVQTGINKADIIYETEVEGGITRLMVVFKDITAVDQLGTIRSARYPYVDLANGHDAVYIHCGQDPKYCAPHLKDIDDISIDTGTCGGTRISNGLAKEHTLYTFGNKVIPGIEQKKIRTTSDSNESWQSFAKKSAELTLSGGSANKITVPFSTSYKTVFNYDSTKKKYTRSFGNTVRKDYVTNETTDVKNVFVLMTSIRDYSDKYHRQVDLIGGSGYYFVNGTYTAINWTKGSSTSSFKFTDLNGNPLEVNAGQSWVCIADKGTSQPIIE